MTTLDIRNDVPSPDEIIFAEKDDHPDTSVPHIINHNVFYIVVGTEANGDGDRAYMCVRKEDVPNLIKALQKSIELGWTK